MEIYYKKDIVEILDRPLRTITQWVDSGFIVPDVEDSRGKGKARIFSERNLIEFAMLDLMSKGLGVKQLEIKFILNNLKGIWDIAWAPFYTLDQIEDFYTSKEWGFSKELAYAHDVQYDLKTKAFKEDENIWGYFHIVEGELYPKKPTKIGGIRFSLPGFHTVPTGGHGKNRDAITVNNNIYWLGSIRNIAIKQFGLTI